MDVAARLQQQTAPRVEANGKDDPARLASAELDTALALEAAGDSRGAEEARARAWAVLDPLGCVNPV